MAVLLKVKNIQTFVENLNTILGNNIGDKTETWITEKFTNTIFYTHYTPEGKWNNKAWFRVCPDDVKKTFNETRKVSYNLIFRLHGTKGDRMTKDLYSFYHSRFIEFLINNMLDEIKDLSITALKEDIEELDRFMNYDWR